MRLSGATRFSNCPAPPWPPWATCRCPLAAQTERPRWHGKPPARSGGGAIGASRLSTRPARLRPRAAARSLVLLLGLDEALGLGLRGLQLLARHRRELVLRGGADPGHLELEVLVLLVVDLVQDLRAVHQGLLAGQVVPHRGEELLELGLGVLLALPGGRAAVLGDHALGLDAEQRRLLRVLVDAAEQHGAAEGADRPVERVGVDEEADALGQELR